MPAMQECGINFGRFTQRAFGVVENAEHFAERQMHPCVDTEHLLCALLFANGKAEAVLKALEFDRRGAQEGMLRRLETFAPRFWEGKFSPPLLRAFQTAELMGDSNVDAEHLLLALLQDENELAAQLLINAGITHERVVATLRLPLYVDNGPG